MNAYEEMKHYQNEEESEQRRIHLEGHGEIPDDAIFPRHYVLLPSLLKIGDKIVQTKYTPHEVLEVMRVDSNLVLLMNVDGNRKYHKPLTIQKLKDYDYKLVCNDPQPATEREA